MASTTIPSTFVNLPVEIRLRIYALLFHCSEPLLIEPAPSSEQDDATPTSIQDASAILDDTIRMRLQPLRYIRPSYLGNSPHTSTSPGLGLSSHVLRLNQQIHDEAMSILYGINIFDCSLRSATYLLTNAISTTNFRLIKHLILDWDQLQDFAFSLAKDSQVVTTSGLETLSLNTFRTRILRSTLSMATSSPSPTPTDPLSSRYAMQQQLGIAQDPPRPSTYNTSTTTNPTTIFETPSPPTWLFEDSKSYERQLHLSALAIIQKHAQLRHVIQETRVKSQPRGYQRAASTDPTGSIASIPIPEMRVTARTRWRFVTERGLRDVREDEDVIDVERELEGLRGFCRKDQGGGMGAIDPI
jgi:hypothetical protein